MKTALKILGVLALIAIVIFILGGQAEATESPEDTTCVGQITGPGTATVTSGTCILVSYAYGKVTILGNFEGSLPQRLHDESSGGESLTVDLPPCQWQMDLVHPTAEIAEVLTGHYYGPNGWLVDSLHGGTVCTPDTHVVVTEEPTTTTTAPTTTVPETTTTIAAVSPSTMPQALARTGRSERKWALVSMGLALGGGALVLISERRKGTT